MSQKQITVMRKGSHTRTRMSLSKSNPNACVEGQSAAGIDPQASQCSVPNDSDWRTEVEKELANTRADVLSLSKKMDLLLQMQMSGSRLNNNTQGSGITYAGADNNTSVEPVETNGHLPGTVSTIQTSSIPEKTCSASALSEEGSERRLHHSGRSKCCLHYVLFKVFALTSRLAYSHAMF